MTTDRPLRVALRCAALASVVAALAVPAAAQLNQPLHRDGWLLAAVHSPGQHGSIVLAERVPTRGSVAILRTRVRRSSSGSSCHSWLNGVPHDVTKDRRPVVV